MHKHISALIIYKHLFSWKIVGKQISQNIQIFWGINQISMSPLDFDVNFELIANNKCDFFILQ